MKKISPYNIALLAKTKYQEVITFLKFVIRNFLDDDCSNFASTLTFTSLLAIVPLMSVSFALLSSFPVFQELSDPIQNYIFEHFVPATGKVVHQYLQSFTNQVSKLSIWGVFFLFVTSVMVMVTIEHAMNKIWKVRVQRHGTSAFLLYWAILSLTPVMLGLSVAASSYLISLPMLTNDLHVNVSILLKYSPFLISLICFCFLYVVVPNCSVKIRHGLVGAIVAALMLELAKKGFSWYLSSYDTYELLYGAFATVPIFFLWVYWAWFIVLLGAEVAYALSAPYHRRTGVSLDGLTHSIEWLGYLWQAQQQGNSLSLECLIRKDKYAYEIKPDIVVQHLLASHLISLGDDGKFILCRDLTHLSFEELRLLLPWRLPQLQRAQQVTSNKKYLALLENSQKANLENFAKPVSAFWS